ncbi:unnamed protein product, partial [Protopolystoma xenopodis]
MQVFYLALIFSVKSFLLLQPFSSPTFADQGVTDVMDRSNQSDTSNNYNSSEIGLSYLTSNNTAKRTVAPTTGASTTGASNIENSTIEATTTMVPTTTSSTITASQYFDSRECGSRRKVNKNIRTSDRLVLRRELSRITLQRFDANWSCNLTLECGQDLTLCSPLIFLLWLSLPDHEYRSVSATKSSMPQPDS